MGLGPDSDVFPWQLKILIAGGFGSGKTTFVGSASEIEPLNTEEHLTTASLGTDSLDGVEHKSTTTVAMDFGRITFSSDNVVLYLFGTPGQDRFWFMWDELSRGTVGAVVIADTRRLQDSFGAIEFFEQRGIDFLVAVNEFDNAMYYTPDEVRNALALSANVPLMLCDARDTQSATKALISLLEYVLATSSPQSAL